MPLPRRRPFVSFHLPICSEPPEIVCNTLSALNALNYDEFEVLVIDNNTRDDRLWKPIEAFCRELGPRFRFFHLEEWPGFKAGALNFALQHTSPKATLIGVIDADYETTPEFLDEVVGYFDDERVGFVQTPQDYRDWSARPFSRMCYWEYWQVFAISMKLRDQRNAILMHGTMSLIRKDAILNAGGWSQWCLTEDSELGLRLLSAGLESIYVTKTYGRGLVPFTFGDYKRQRRRWVIGGVQQLKRHITILLPWGRHRDRVTAMQAIHYFRGWLLWFRDGVIIFSVLPSLLAALAMFAGVLQWDALFPLALGLLAIIGQLIARQIIVYVIYLSVNWRDAIGAMIANCSLTWTVGCAWLAGSTNADQIFQRTPKTPHTEPSWIAVAAHELVVGLLMLIVALALGIRLGTSGWGTITALTCCSALLLPSAFMARRSAKDAAATAENIKF